jgi:MurNAc alpha-1-phosphate uridylyltransferase
MLDRALDAMAAAGVKEAVVNTHYLADMVEERLTGRNAPRITVSREENLLDTGGGVRKMLPFFGDEPFYVLNADVVWTNGRVPALTRLAEAWDSSRMDLLLLLKATQDLPSWNGQGDYYLADGSDAPVFRTRSQKPADYLFTGVRIVHPRLFEGVTKEAFGFLELFHKAEASGRVAALRHDGDLYHVGNPEAYTETNRILSAGRQEKKAALCPL